MSNQLNDLNKEYAVLYKTASELISTLTNELECIKYESLFYMNKGMLPKNCRDIITIKATMHMAALNYRLKKLLTKLL